MAMRPKNWDKFQHYRNRRPTWIKLHRELLDKEEFYALKGEDAKYLFMIWLIASEEHGQLPPIKQLAFRLRLTVPKCEELLGRLGDWLESSPCEVLAEEPKPASNLLADCKQVAIPEREKEKEREKEELKLSSAAPTPASKAAPLVRPEEFANTWNRERGPLPKVEAFTESRRKKVKARIRQGITLERFQEAVACCRGKPFLRGENERGWTATFDWLIENDRNIEKAITGYSRTGAGHGSQLGESNGDRAMRVLAESLAADQARADAVRHLPAGEDRQISLGTLLGKIGAGAG